MNEIEVVYSNGMFGFVAPRELDRLIANGEIIKFLRGGSWVYPGVDPTRTGASKSFDWEKRSSENAL